MTRTRPFRALTTARAPSLRRVAKPDLLADPFRERSTQLLREDVQVLGGRFRFETASPRLLKLVRAAFAGLPAHRLPGPIPRFRIRLELTPSGRPHRVGGDPPPMNLL